VPHLRAHSAVLLAGGVAAAVVATCNPPQPSARQAQVAPSAPAHVAASAPGGAWNAAQIAWVSFEAGLARARAERKKVCLVLHASWCSHCRNFERVFEDPRVVARARDFVMVNVDIDHEPAVSSRYSIDGAYVPRTFFLDADGSALADVDAHRPSYRFFFDEHNAAPLLAAMDAAAAHR